MATYRVEYLDHRPGQYPGYGDCWRPVIPDRRYTRIKTALRIMHYNAASLTALAYRNCVTRVIEINAAGEEHEIAAQSHSEQN